MTPWDWFWGAMMAYFGWHAAAWVRQVLERAAERLRQPLTGLPDAGQFKRRALARLFAQEVAKLPPPVNMPLNLVMHSDVPAIVEQQIDEAKRTGRW